MKLVKDNAKLASLVKSIQTRGAKLDNDIHLCAVSCIALIARDRNTTRVTNLVNAMPKSSRRKALCDWFESLVPLTISYETGKVSDFAKADSDQWQEFLAEYRARLTRAVKVPFWDLKPEKGAKDVLTYDAVLKYLKRKANSKGIDAELQAQLSALVSFADTLTEGSQMALPLSGGTSRGESRVH